MDGLGNDLGQIGICRCHIVQGTMGFNMVQRGSLCLAKGLERPYLVGKVVTYFLVAAIHLSATKTKEVRKARVCAYGNAVLSSKANCPPHDQGVTGMEATGDIG